MLTAEPENRCARRVPFVEHEDARIGVAAKLQQQGREQHRFADASRTDHQRVADVADMRHQTKRRGAFGTRDDERWAVEMRVALGSRPHGR